MGYSRKKTWVVAGGKKRRERDAAHDFWEGPWYTKTAGGASKRAHTATRTRSRFGRKAVKSTTFYGAQMVGVRTKTGFNAKTVHRLTQRWF